jgi:hypothetical protein
MEITCPDQKSRLLFDGVIRRINEAFASIDGEPFDLLGELASDQPDRAARFVRVVFDEFADGPSVAGSASIKIGVSIEPKESFGTVRYSLSMLRKLSEKAQQGVMVHELGHAWDMVMTGNYSAERGDEVADEYACEWGFEEEIRQMYSEVRGERMVGASGCVVTFTESKSSEGGRQALHSLPRNTTSKYSASA